MSEENETFSFPEQGFVFWPVGTGDSTSIAVSGEVVVQVDLNHLECANEEDDPHTPIVDRLEESLPNIDGEPYLSVFVLTHPDQDHCRGFADLLERVTIGEIWFTPRVFREYVKDLCDDAKAFRTEAKRRVRATIAAGGVVGAGDRVRIVGYDDLLEEDDYKGFPKSRLTVPGTEISELDGEDQSARFRAFVHAPFKGDSSGDRNATSLGLQVSLYRGKEIGKAMLLGDLCYPTVKRIFDVSTDEDLEWNTFLAPHHCSKSVMYWQDEGDDEEKLKQELLDQIEAAGQSPGYTVSSSKPVPASNKSGDNPPHAKAKARYEEITLDDFICTQEHPDEDDPEPLVFELTDEGLTGPSGTDDDTNTEGEGGLVAAVAAARGSEEPPVERVGFGEV